MHWVARVPDARAAVHALAAQPSHIDRGQVLAASRKTPQGRLDWQITVRDDGQRLFYGALPTLIQWGGAHPADGFAPSGLSLLALEATHPRPEVLQAALATVGAKDLITVIGPRLFTCIAMTGAAAGAILQFLITHPASALMVSTRVWFLSVFLAIGSTVLPSFFLNAALHRISAQANATIGTLSPVATILLAWAILGETMTPIAWLGTALVMVGVGWFTLGGRK